MSFNREQPYNNLPLLWPDEKFWKTISVYEKLNEANKALAELKGHLSAIPNPRIFINTLALQEAKDSSAIENVFTTNDKLYKAFTSEKTADRSTKEVLRYGKALMTSYARIKDSEVFSVSYIEEIYRIIKDETDGIRDIDVYIGNSFEIRYTPPSGKVIILKKLDNWISKAKSDHIIDPLIKMAMLHYQFEAIHPFKDGNGRAGRVLNVLYLCFHNLLDDPVLYISKYINIYKEKYYNLLLGVTEKQEWENWLLFMLEAVRATANHTLKKVKTIERLFDETRRTIEEKAKRIYKYELVELLFTQVYCKYDFLVERKIGNRNTASDYLNQLADMGILEKEKMGTEFIFKNKALYELFIND